MIKILVKTELYPSEDPEKIKRVLKNCVQMPEENEINIKFESKKDPQGNIFYQFEMEGIDAINKLHYSIRKQKIVQAARSYAFSRFREGNSKITLLLNKQGLYVNTFHFCDEPSESALGPVWYTIESDNLERLLEYIFPMTEKGIPIEVNYVPK